MLSSVPKRRLGVAAFALTSIVAGCGHEDAPLIPGGLFSPGPVGATTAPVPTASGVTATSAPVTTASPVAGTTASPVSSATPIATAKPTASAVATATAVATAVATATPAPVATASTPAIVTTGNTTCTAPSLGAGTYYTDLVAIGNVTGSTYAIDTAEPNMYSLVTLVAATPTPTPVPVPSVAPTSTPSPVAIPTFTPFPVPTSNPQYDYIGEYATTSGTHPTTGCAFIGTSQNGTALAPGVINDNAEFAGFITYDPSLFSVQTNPLPGSGTISALTVSNLGPSSGSGTFTLSDGTQGTISITGRISAAEFRRHQAELRRRLTLGGH